MKALADCSHGQKGHVTKSPGNNVFVHLTRDGRCLLDCRNPFRIFDLDRRQSSHHPGELQVGFHESTIQRSGSGGKGRPTDLSDCVPNAF